MLDDKTFSDVAVKLINKGIANLREKKYQNGLTDLDQLVKTYDQTVQSLSKNKIGIALLPSSKQTHPHLDHHRFYVLSVVNEDRKQMLGALSIIAVSITGEYPVFVLDPNERAYGIADLDGLEANFLQHSYTVASKIFAVIS